MGQVRARTLVGCGDYVNHRFKMAYQRPDVSHSDSGQITPKWQVACYYRAISRSNWKSIANYGAPNMNALLLMALVRLQTVLLEEQGQDLIEYVLVSALIALGATAGMTTLATAINSAFANLATTFTSAL